MNTSNNVWNELNIKRASDKEQAETGLADFAAALSLFRKELLQNGFSKEESLYLTGQWVTAVIQSNKK